MQRILRPVNDHACSCIFSMQISFGDLSSTAMQTCAWLSGLQWVQQADIPERYVLMSEPDHVWLKPMPNLMRVRLVPVLAHL